MLGARAMGRILGIGLDVAGVRRFERLLRGPHGARFVARCFTKAERAICDGRKNRAEAYAARFAAKEALVKALGAPPGIHWSDMEVRADGQGAPAMRLTGAAAREVRRRRAAVHLAITHDAGIAAAAVVLEGPGR